MRKLLSQFRTRLIVGSLLFLLGLTGAVILVVRDSLLFSARDTAKAGEQALVDQWQASMLEIVQREAELGDHAVHHNPVDLAPLDDRLLNLYLTPNGFAFVMNAEGELVSISSEKVGKLFDEEAWMGRSLLETTNADLKAILLEMQKGSIGVRQVEVQDEAVLFAYAPLEEMGWSLGMVEPVADITSSAEPLAVKIQNNVSTILRTTLITIGYFAVLIVIGAVLAARSLTDPIRGLVDGTRAIASGNLAARISVKSKDELGMLAESFNTMADSLQTRTDELVKANEAAVENARQVEQTRTLAAVEERQRLARELHDSVAQSLYSLTLLAEASRRTAKGGDLEKVESQIARLGEMAQQTLKEMRLLVYQLRPMALQSDTLADAIQHRLDAVEKRAGVSAHLYLELEADLPASVENDLFRIVQETLNNAIKHAEAAETTVTLRGGSEFVEVVIEDNGRGFDLEAAQAQGGMGIDSIRERTQALGGTCSILSKMGKGTRVVVTVPIKK